MWLSLNIILASRVNQILQTKQFSGRVDTPVEVQKILGGVYFLKCHKKFSNFRLFRIKKKKIPRHRKIENAKNGQNS